MSARRILYLSNHQMSVFSWQGSSVHGEGNFDPSAQGIAAFAEYVAANPKCIYTLLVNFPEEGFQLESIPFRMFGPQGILRFTEPRPDQQAAPAPL